MELLFRWPHQRVNHCKPGLSADNLGSGRSKGAKVVPLEESCIIAETGGISLDRSSEEEDEKEESDLNVFDRFECFLTVLNEGEALQRKCKVVEQIRVVLKEDEEARMVMGSKGFVQTLVKFLNLAVEEGNSKAQESAAMALFNLAVNNSRNKEMMLKAGIISLLERMIRFPRVCTALYLNLSCLEDAQEIVGQSCAVLFLCDLLQTKG